MPRKAKARGSGKAKPLIGKKSPPTKRAGFSARAPVEGARARALTQHALQAKQAFMELPLAQQAYGSGGAACLRLLLARLRFLAGKWGTAVFSFMHAMMTSVISGPVSTMALHASRPLPSTFA